MTTSQSDSRDARQPYSGYHQTWTGQSDAELTRVGPGASCGEYLRRFWHPVAIASELGELPQAIRVMGEDLVLFRDRSDRVGLVHKRCPHRRSSLEFGVCEARGIRCCYHGWLFDVSGQILEVPGQPAGVEERIQAAVTLGAYPVHEYKGLIFAYMGPPALKPAFPIYDSFELPDQVMSPYKAPFACNWLQVLDAILDPLHTAFLHSSVSREQFSPGFGEIGEFKFHERPSGFLGVATRRVGDNAWVRVNELVFPNFTQAGAAFAADGTQQRYFGRSSFIRWVVPVDDHHTMCFAWAAFGERGDPIAYDHKEGYELIEQGEVFDRSYEQKQRFPGDAEATEGMGPITEHDKENLVPTDKGVVLYRKRLKAMIRALTKGREPDHLDSLFVMPIPTYGGDTVLRAPVSSGEDRALLRTVAKAVMEIQFDAEALTGPARDERIIAALRAREVEGFAA